MSSSYNQSIIEARPSAALRTQLRKKILKRIDELEFKDIEAAGELGLAPGLASSVRSDG